MELENSPSLGCFPNINTSPQKNQPTARNDTSHFQSRLKFSRNTNFEEGQYVISYNFDNQSSKSKTHNLLIGMPSSSQNKLTKMKKNVEKSQYFVKDRVDQSKSFLSPFGNKYPDIFVQNYQKNQNKGMKQHFSSHSSKENFLPTSYSNNNRIKRSNQQNKKHFHHSQNKIGSQESYKKQNQNYSNSDHLKLQKINNKGSRLHPQHSKIVSNKQNEQLGENGNKMKYAGVKTVRKLNRNHMSDHQYLKQHKVKQSSKIDKNKQSNEFFDKKDKAQPKILPIDYSNQKNNPYKSQQELKNITKQLSIQHRKNITDQNQENQYFQKNSLPTQSKIQRLDLTGIPPRYLVQGIHRQKQWKQTSRSMSKDSRKFEESENNSSGSKTHNNSKKEQNIRSSMIENDSKNNSLEKNSPSNSRHNNAKLNTIAEVMEDRAVTAKLNSHPNNRNNNSTHDTNNGLNKNLNTSTQQKLKYHQAKQRGNAHNLKRVQSQKSNNITKPFFKQNSSKVNRQNKQLQHYPNKNSKNIPRKNRLEQNRIQSSQQKNLNKQSQEQRQYEQKKYKAANYQEERDNLNQNLEQQFLKNQNNWISRLSSVRNQEDSRVEDDRVLLTQIQKAQQSIKNRQSQQKITQIASNQQFFDQNLATDKLGQSQQFRKSNSKQHKKFIQKQHVEAAERNVKNNPQDIELTKKKGKPKTSQNPIYNNAQANAREDLNEIKNMPNKQKNNQKQLKTRQSQKILKKNTSQKQNSKSNKKQISQTDNANNSNQTEQKNTKSINRIKKNSDTFKNGEFSYDIDENKDITNKNSAGQSKLIKNQQKKSKSDQINKKQEVGFSKANEQLYENKADKIREDTRNVSQGQYNQISSKISSRNQSRKTNSNRNLRDSSKNSMQSSLRNSFDNSDKKSNKNDKNIHYQKNNQHIQKHVSSSKDKKRSNASEKKSIQNSPKSPSSSHRRTNSKTRQDSNRKIPLQKVNERVIKTSSRKNTRKPIQQKQHVDSFIMNDEILDDSITSDITEKAKEKKNRFQAKKQKQNENIVNSYPNINSISQPLNNQNHTNPNVLTNTNLKNIDQIKPQQDIKNVNALQSNQQNKKQQQKSLLNQFNNGQDKLFPQKNQNINNIKQNMMIKANSFKQQGNSSPNIKQASSQIPSILKKQCFTNTASNIQDPTSTLKKQFKSYMSQTLNSNTYQESQSRYHFNETYDQLGINKNQLFIDKVKENYDRAPLVSFLYGLNGQYAAQISKYDPSHGTIQNSIFEEYQYDPNKDKIYQSLSILQSVDNWIIQRIIQPINTQRQEIGIWMFCKGAWRSLILPYKNSPTLLQLITRALQKACQMFLQRKLSQLSLEQIMRMISGLRIIKMKNNSKKIFKEAQYSIKRNHVVKALVKEQNLKNNKIQHKLCDVIKVETLVNGSNAIQIRFKNQIFNQSQSIDYHPEEQFFWVKEEKFVERFNYFLLISNRECSFWTYFQPQLKKSFKTVYKIRANIPTSGTISLQYKSNCLASLLFYKQIQPKVLKFVGKVNQKNKGDNIYFDFYVKGNYYLFIQCQEEENCLLTYQGNSQIQFQFIEWVKSESLRNDQCQYVQMLKLKKKEGKANMLREKFIDFLLNK